MNLTDKEIDDALIYFEECLEDIKNNQSMYQKQAYPCTISVIKSLKYCKSEKEKTTLNDKD